MQQERCTKEANNSNTDKSGPGESKTDTNKQSVNTNAFEIKQPVPTTASTTIESSKYSKRPSANSSSSSSSASSQREVGNNLSHRTPRKPQYTEGHHECEIFGKGPETAESGFLWDNCEKNPGHKKFIPVQNFTAKHLPNMKCDQQREMLRKAVDRTVRLRVRWTSVDRLDEDDFSEYRGTDRLRVGTGFIRHVSENKTGIPCPCLDCDGKVTRNHWTFTVQTAHHVVFNSEEARRTGVDLFYDNESSQRDGRMKTLQPVEAKWFNSAMDICVMLCVTHDESLANRISLSTLLSNHQNGKMPTTSTDRTVRLRVGWTSLERPLGNNRSVYRGTDTVHFGTGFLRHVTEEKSNKPCPCCECGGNVSRRHWTFTVQTACHVVFNTEEARKTKVDLFYDDIKHEANSRMKAVTAVKVLWSNPDSNFCTLLCATHDETLAQKIKLFKNPKYSSTWFPRRSNIINPYAPSGRIVIISHPHGQSKKITVGKCEYWGDISKAELSLRYHTPTCPGSSGAPLLLINCTGLSLDPSLMRWRGLVHSGTCGTASRKRRDQVNYCQSLVLLYNIRSTKS
ncbi:hypothetical protein ElyMa_001883800 [Elysia marginata]|uniref:Peptidase S1 domain-containing protein n=1 Tax=Elysia marginata TaxID=1093978 RepID=A0AAV4EQJ9_9GAST|nr:hypothetical protein ElyMa_001883800 [Elysia marginata]